MNHLVGINGWLGCTLGFGLGWLRQVKLLQHLWIQLSVAMESREVEKVLVIKGLYF